ncbi:MAG: CoA transferase, partial [Acidimicrobiales bacterium]
ALYQRTRTGRGQRVEVAMRHSVLNLCRVKLRDQQRLAHGPLPEYPNGSFGSFVPRSGNASGGGQPGAALRCSPGGPNDYVYVIIQPQGWEALAAAIGRPDLAGHPDYATPEARLPRLDEVWGIVEAWTRTLTKWDVFERLEAIGVPCGPIFDTRDLIEDETLAGNGMIVEVDHPERGPYRTVGSPLRLSDSPAHITRSPLLGEHSAEVLMELCGCTSERVAELAKDGVI